jgi:hypothetical protein
VCDVANVCSPHALCGPDVGVVDELDSKRGSVNRLADGCLHSNNLGRHLAGHHHVEAVTRLSLVAQQLGNKVVVCSRHVELESGQLE